MKRTWRILKSVMNKYNTKPTLPKYFIHDNDKLTNKEDIAQQFNNFFSTIGETVSNNVPDTDVPFTDFLPPNHNRSMFLTPVTNEEILTTTSKLKAKTSCGHDNISTKLTKQSITHIVQPLTHIINQSLCPNLYEACQSYTNFQIR